MEKNVCLTMLVRLTSSVIAVFKILRANVRYLAYVGKLCGNKSQCPQNECCASDKKCSPSCVRALDICNSNDDCAKGEICCDRASNVTGKCAKSCVLKSCENRNHCEPTEFCSGMYPNKTCALNCSGAHCLYDSDSAFGSLDKNSIRKCNGSCLGKSCDYDSQCGSGTYCCDFDGYKMCRLNCSGEPCSSHSNCTSNDHCCGIQGYCVKSCLGADCEDKHQCEPNQHCCDSVCSSEGCNIFEIDWTVMIGPIFLYF